MKTFNSIITPGSLCFDIGANNGNKTQEFLEFGASVVCLEPQDICFGKLVERFAENKKVTIVKSAVGSKPGTGKIFISAAHTLSTMSETFIEETQKDRFKGVNWNNSQEVPLTTLNELIRQYGCPHFCKIDVEGFESEVLRGLSIPIQFISVEFTPELKQKTFECIDLMCNIGDYVFNYSEAESNEFSFEEWIEKEAIIEFLVKNNDFSVSFGDLYAKLR